MQRLIEYSSAPDSIDPSRGASRIRLIGESAADIKVFGLLEGGRCLQNQKSV